MKLFCLLLTSSLALEYKAKNEGECLKCIDSGFKICVDENFPLVRACCAFENNQAEC